MSKPMQSTIHVYEVRPRNDKRGVELASDVLLFGRLWYEQARMQSTTRSFSAVHIMLPSPKRQARPRVLQKHLAISPIPLPFVAAP